MDRIIETMQAPPAIGPYSQAVTSGGFLFISGQSPMNPETGEFPDGIKSQAKQCLENIKAILDAAGLPMSAVKKTTIFVTDIDSFSDVNEVYKRYFQLPFPSRSCVEVRRLPKGAQIEIEVVARDKYQSRAK